jgi:dTDP-4-amino-4,6-dideoxygalactose transaminase
MKISPWPSYSEEEIQAVSNVLSSNKVNYWTGSNCNDFENQFSKWVGVDYAIAVSNGSVALELALIALGIGPGDEVIVTPRSFIASVSSVVLVGATPIFADVDHNSQNITAETISIVLTVRTKAIICVHLAGMPCEMDAIMSLAKDFDLKVIEDCAQAHGALYRNKVVGSIGHIGVWSFCQDKIITTGGEGGMVATNDFSLFETMWSYKDHGKSWKDTKDKTQSNGPRLVHKTFGTNWRMMEIQAVIGAIQLKRISAMGIRRSEIATAIGNVCRNYSIFRVPNVPMYIKHAYYRFYAFIEPDKLALGWTRDRIISDIRFKGVSCSEGTCAEIYLEPAFESLNMSPPKRLPVARELGETSISFLVHPTITNHELDNILFILNEVFLDATSIDY